MSVLQKAGLSVLRRVDPERAHKLALCALRAGLAGKTPKINGPRLMTCLGGVRLHNPLGLAAGFDKNGEAIRGLSQIGFGFVEVGATTPRPQPGNARPRVFRLPEDAAVINRFGFNNDGMQAMAAKLARRPRNMVLGLNLGANKDSADRAADYAAVLTCCGPHLDFATVNVSSPNTEKLRDLQGKAALRALLERVLDARAALPRPVPVFLKIAPDLTPSEIDDIAEIALELRLDAVVATNTTVARDGLRARQAHEKGGLSGAPLFEKSTRVLAQLSKATEGRVALVGVGGVSSAEEAYEKIKAGASALQLYTALVYHGTGLVAEIAHGLDRLLARDGFDSVYAAIGSGREAWL